MPYGVVSCQPAFEAACKPKIVFENGDPGGRGKVFTDVIPNVEATMKDIACTACSMLYRNPGEIPQNKHPSTITLKLDDHGGVAQAGGGTIQFDLTYINGYADDTPERTKREIEKSEKELASLDAKLANEQFVRNAPERVVQQARSRQAELRTRLEKLQQNQ